MTMCIKHYLMNIQKKKMEKRWTKNLTFTNFCTSKKEKLWTSEREHALYSLLPLYFEDDDF